MQHHHHGAWCARIAAVMAVIAMTGFVLPRSVEAQTPVLAPCPTGLTITATAPTAAAPTTVSATVAPALNLKAASAADLLSFHLHYYVDVDPTTTLKPGATIPSGDPKIVHSGVLAQDVGTLTPRPHTVWVVLGQLGHQACGGADGNVAAGKVTFMVAADPAAPAQAAPAPAKSGNAGLVAPTAWPIVPLALAVFALLVIGGARVVTARRD